YHFDDAGASARPGFAGPAAPADALAGQPRNPSHRRAVHCRARRLPGRHLAPGAALHRAASEATRARATPRGHTSVRLPPSPARETRAPPTGAPPTCTCGFDARACAVATLHAP